MNKQNLELRMYGFVPYQLSGIQAGIQFGHAVVEYSLKHGNSKKYKEWSSKWKTFIVLNGGTTNMKLTSQGTMNLYADEVSCYTKIARFHEPDLGDQLSAFVFIVDERVFNYEKYPSYESYMKYDDGFFFDSKNEYYKRIFKVKSNSEVQNILNLRNFLKNKKLA